MNNLLTQIKQKQTNLQKNVNDLNQLIYQLEIKDKDDESKSQDSDSSYYSQNNVEISPNLKMLIN